MKIVFLDAATMGDTPLVEIAGLGELVCHDSSSAGQAKECVGDCDVLIVNKVRVTDDLLDCAPRLRLVCEAATGVNNIDLAACAERGIEVRNVAGYSTDAVVQGTFTHVLSLVGNAPLLDGRVKSGEYSRSGCFTDVTVPWMELCGKTYGVIGMGAIGSRVAAIAAAFGMKVVYYSTSGTSHNTDYPSVPLDELMSRSDVISVHAPYNDRTAGLVGERELRLMKPTGIIVNMGRGGIVDEAALARVVDEDVIGGAALDVFVHEPVEEDNPLLHTSHPEKLRFTPHTAWASVEARARLAHEIAMNIRRFYGIA